uniref:Putative terminase n=1 Tax=viral metagenome TaxID=1070528 RepID=A0A6M3K4I8_9ZZZZ
MPAIPKNIDWDAIEREYRTAQFSNREIAYQFGCSHTAIQKRAKKYGWKQDLSNRVKEAVSRKAVSIVANLDKDATDDEIVDVVSDRAVEALELQRKDIQALRQTEQRLLKELEDGPTKLYLAQYQGKIVEKVVGLTVSEQSVAVANLAAVQHKRIALERQALGIDSDGRRADPVDEITINFKSPEDKNTDE